MERASWFTTATCPYVRSIWKLASMSGSLVIRSDSCGAEPGGGDPGYATQSPVGRPRKKPSLIRAHKNQNPKTPNKGKQGRGAGVPSPPTPHAPALIDKVSR